MPNIKRAAKGDPGAGATKLPPIRAAAIDAIMSLLVQKEGMPRPPEKSAALMALIVELHKKGMPFPTRQAAATHIARFVSDSYCSKFTVDAALSSRMEEGYIVQRVETSPGNVAKRNSIVRSRFYEPSKELIDIAENCG